MRNSKKAARIMALILVLVMLAGFIPSILALF